MITDTASRAPRVVVTRPAGQHADFAQLCRNLGFDVVLLPCIAIEPVVISDNEIEQQRGAHNFTLFTSSNAVRYAHALAPLPWPDTKVHAIGAATARCLQSLGQTLHLTPQAPYSSEAYLQQLAAYDKQRLLIIKGIGGRELIPERLRDAGWIISCIDVYKRVCASHEAGYINQLFLEQQPDVICITSDEILTNLWQLCYEHHVVLRKIQLVVNSSRCATLARQMGFTKAPLIANPAGDAGQISCLQEWLIRYWR